MHILSINNLLFFLSGKKACRLIFKNIKSGSWLLLATKMIKEVSQNA
jgi:hypothetical protein